ncbi:hypothetical protein X798_03722 [Onchocerca flexuosa]|uniref:Transmembrane protein n=2 Tax=Onchocerca flexuosa TaxID=387005 RepID=A0A183H3K6_9BILA|nr:hypothetical protein X798_03722 [Onchocerca flexuosa]VDO31752.1 unnamed protein product [Onchocerca flexuosa]
MDTRSFPIHSKTRPTTYALAEASYKSLLMFLIEWYNNDAWNDILNPIILSCVMTQSPALINFTANNPFSDNERQVLICLLYFISIEITTWERHRDDIVVVTIWLIMLSYALTSNILILIGIARNNSMRCSTTYFLGLI